VAGGLELDHPAQQLAHEPGVDPPPAQLAHLGDGGELALDVALGLAAPGGLLQGLDGVVGVGVGDVQPGGQLAGRRPAHRVGAG
jgi:hypothetical protein